ncbi:hypothetical protein Slala02_01680 [Streptomyces lavendulae subsp. lavendulae]|nr:hypothetical protein Slala01_64650 [Streptomyces lavendulae subsp. lavendulae]GLX24348.1 hypothetical protein Slala02_01680 [Streptomyces lavendulae subsp. lavendulae]
MFGQPSRSPAVVTGAAVVALAVALAGCGTTKGEKGEKGEKGKKASAASSPAAPAASPSAEGRVRMPAGPPPAMTKARDTAVGPVMVTRLAGPKSGVTGQVWVWLPPEYHDPKYAKTGFPVLTLFAGGQSNGYNTWAGSELPIPEEDARLAKAGKAHPFIMVMPVQNFSGDEKKALDCSDIPGQPKMATWMAQDIPDWVRANFRTLKGRDSWGVMGASTGGFCSAKLALQYPDVYRAAVPIDGYFAPDSRLWQGHEAEKAANSPDQLVAQGKADVKMLVTAGGADGYEKGVVRSWMAKAVPPVAIEYYEQPGGKHLTSDFKKMIPDALQWFTKNLEGPAHD